MHFDIRISCFGHASDVLNDNKDVSADYAAIIEGSLKIQVQRVI
ncbi:hypothetical protein [Xanthomonas oryzae]|nr:hypothetical protein [Xanthomonas oryzae]